MFADQIRDALARIPQPALAPTRQSFIEYMRFCHGIMLSTETLLEMAAKACPRGMLRSYYERSLQDEQGHALWIEEDLASMDEKIGPLDHACAWLAGAQYYYLHHVGPQPLLGYIASLEMRPPTLNDVVRLEELHGKRAVRTIRHHAEVDLEHSERLAEVLNEQNEHREAILYNAITSAQAFSYYCAEKDRTMNGFDFGALSPEQLEYIMQNLPDLTGQEEGVMRQQAMADALRPRTTQRMDTASQLARALSGVASGYQQGMAQKGRTGVGEAYRKFALGMPRRRRPNELTGTGQPVGDQAFFDPGGIDPNQFSWP